MGMGRGPPAPRADEPAAKAHVARCAPRCAVVPVQPAAMPSALVLVGV